jgi:hypothetical protein
MKLTFRCTTLLKSKIWKFRLPPRKFGRQSSQIQSSKLNLLLVYIFALRHLACSGSEPLHLLYLMLLQPTAIITIFFRTNVFRRLCWRHRQGLQQTLVMFVARFILWDMFVVVFTLSCAVDRHGASKHCIYNFHVGGEGGGDISHGSVRAYSLDSFTVYTDWYLQSWFFWLSVHTHCVNIIIVISRLYHLLHRFLSSCLNWSVLLSDTELRGVS